MTNLFINIFHFFRKHRALYYGVLTLSSVLFVYFGLQLNYEENIAKLLPSIDNTKAEGLAFTELKVREKIFVQLVSENSETDANELIEATDRLINSLLAYDVSDNDVGDILYKIDEEMKQEMLTFVLENVPTLLDTTLYAKIDSFTTQTHIFQQMQTNLEQISSPEGFIYSRIIRYDPLNLRSIIMPENDIDLAQMLGGSFVFYENHLFSSDTTVAFAFISPDFAAFDSWAGTRLVKKLQRSAEQVEKNFPGIKVMYHGPPVQSMFNSRQIRQDLVFTLGISLLFSCLLIVVCFRNKSTLPMLLLPIIYGAFFSLACMFFLQGMMSLMTLGIGAVVLGVALSYCLHVITHFKYLTDPEYVLRDQVRPVILGSLTTIGAFMGLLFTQSTLLLDFGLFASFAMIGTTIACLIFLPQIFPAIRNRRYENVFSVLEKINSYHLDRQYWLLVLIVGLFVAGLFLRSKVQFDTNLRNIGYFDPIVSRSMDFFAEKTSNGYVTSYYAATAENPDSAFHNNMRVNVVCDSLQSAGKIAHYSNSSSFLLPNAEQEKRIATWSTWWSEERINQLKKDVITAGEAYKFRPTTFDPFFELLTKTFQPSSIYDSGVIPGSILDNIVEHSQGMFLVYTAVHLEAENLREVNDVLASQPHVIVCDPFYYTTNMLELMHRDFTTILNISSLFVLFVLFCSLRSIPLAVIAFLPMSMSWYIVLGVMAMFGIQFNLINIVISTFIFGIGVDYSIFIMEGLLSDVKQSDPKLLMYHKTAIFLSAVVLIISISSLIFAKHPALSSIGFATLIGMTSTILTSYSLQPFLFKLLMKTPYGNFLRKKYLKTKIKI